MFAFVRLGRAQREIHWPEGTEPMEGVVLEARLPGGAAVEVYVGSVISGREAFGRQRARIHVMIGNDVGAEFVGTDDHESSREVLSVLKLPGGHKHAASLSDVPEQYRRFRTERFSERIRQKWAFSSLAVVAREDDYETMAAYGLCRWLDRRPAAASRQRSGR